MRQEVGADTKRFLEGILRKTSLNCVNVACTDFTVFERTLLIPQGLIFFKCCSSNSLGTVLTPSSAGKLI